MDGHARGRSAHERGGLDVSGALAGFEVYIDAIPEPKQKATRTKPRLDLSPYQALAGDPSALADRLDRNLMAGRMSAAMKAAIVGAVNAVPASDALGRARTAAYLVVTSPQFQVER